MRDLRKGPRRVERKVVMKARRRVDWMGLMTVRMLDLSKVMDSTTADLMAEHF